MGTSLNVLLTQRGLVGTGKNSTSPPFHSDDREEAFCTATTTLPCRTTRGRLQTHRGRPPEQHALFPAGFPPARSFQFLCESAGYQVHIWWLNGNVQLLRAGGRARRAGPPPVRGTGRLSATAERGWPSGCSSSKPNSSRGKALPGPEASGQGFYQGSSLDLYSPGFPQKIQGRVRFVGRDVARNRIIFKLFLLQPDAGCPFFPGGQPLLPKVWRAGKLNPTCSVLFSARGGKRSQNPMFKT